VHGREREARGGRVNAGEVYDDISVERPMMKINYLLICIIRENSDGMGEFLSPSRATQESNEFAFTGLPPIRCIGAATFSKEVSTI